jgi:hypothetical protein
MDHLVALANEILPLLRANTLRGLVRTSGYYAYRSGQSAVDVGHALHLIGAACVFARVPVAPVHFIEDIQDDWRLIFTVAAADSDHADAWPLICTTSRAYAYSESDFEHVATMVRSQLSRYGLDQQAPLGLWRLVVEQALPQALARYQQVIDHSGALNSAWPMPTAGRSMPARPLTMPKDSFGGTAQVSESIALH